MAAQQELRRPAAALFWSATAAGLTIGFSFLAGVYLMALVPATYRGWQRLWVIPWDSSLWCSREASFSPKIRSSRSSPCSTLKTLRQLLSAWRILTPHPARAQTATAGGFRLIALMAWLIASTRSTGAQVLLIWLTTAPISALGFRHSVAGSVEAFYVAFEHAAGWREMAGSFHPKSGS